MPTEGHVTGHVTTCDMPTFFKFYLSHLFWKNNQYKLTKLVPFLRLRTLIWDLSSMCANLLPLICKWNDSHGGRPRWSWQQGVLFPQHESLARFASENEFCFQSHHLAKTTMVTQTSWQNWYRLRLRLLNWRSFKHMCISINFSF